MPIGLILQPTYQIRDERPVVQLFGRLEDGPPFLIEDDRFRPYLFVRARDVAQLGQVPGMTVEVKDLRDLDGAPVARVVLPLPSAVPALRDRLAKACVATFEADVRFAYRYLIDHGIRTVASIEGEAEERDGGLLLFRNPTLRPATARPALRVLSLDIETTPDAARMLSIAFAGCGSEEVHLVATRDVDGAHVHRDERAMLTAAVARLRALDPDVLLGWNVVDFDLRVLARRCAALRVPGAIGRVPGRIGFEQDRTFTRQGRAEVPGRMVLDGTGLVRDAVRLPDYRLETVAQAVLGRGKLITDTPDAAAEIQRLYREDPEALAAYNLEDARLALEIVEKEGLLDLTLERSLLSGMQLDRVGASIASFDQIYLPELRRRGVVAPNVLADRPGVSVQGGAVLDSAPGIFRNVAVFDFKSLYPSLIRTFNLDPWAHARARRDGAEGDAIVAPNGARFAREDAILPALLDGFIARRDLAKQRGDRHADQAIKIMMNALFGVLGATACRFFDGEIANAITLFGQQTLHWTRLAFEEEGFRVLYGDTDSVFVKLDEDGVGATLQQAEALREHVERRVVGRVRDEYGVEPRLTLELEHVMERFFMPRVRSGTGGSKKRYAGWVDGELLVVGLESVRRDWPVVARRLQEGILTRVFTDQDPMPFVTEVVAQVRAGTLDDELVYAKRVRKGALDRYTAATPPHVQAARKAGPGAGPVIRYVITRGGPEPALPGRPLPGDIDRGHYVDRVLRPIGDAILPELGRDFDEATGEPRQLSLL